MSIACGDTRDVDEQSRYELGTDGPRVMVVGIDGSPTSLRAAAYATGMARRQGSRLVFVYVVGYSAVSGLAAGFAGPLTEAYAQVADELQHEVVDLVNARGVEASLQVRRGDPYTELSRAADDEQADAVLVGASMQAGHKLIGSLAGRLVRASRWPVTVVP
ncbi:universal stress protein A [Actinocatenispora comari]|jgi:nucleotide-binding universal stress UspA family protein|uniref:Universal stress protein A n=1 Tax=Actinocatenispora comari TaxID=2807577 RepID=A0A8J4AFJ5_9ACTN|nr:universal stress protein A [Actinocatenispora comari]